MQIARNILLVLFLSAGPLLACPMCKDDTIDPAQSNSTNATESASLDFNKSIYILLGATATVAGFTGRVMFKAIKS